MILPAALSRALALRVPTALLGICPSWGRAWGTPLVWTVSETVPIVPIKFQEGLCSVELVG